MKIKYLYLRDLRPGLQMPGPDTLHIWTFRSETSGNMHKALHKYSHELLHRLLSSYTGQPESGLVLAAGKYGKPYLLPAAGQPGIHFNLSHAGDYIVFIFSSCTSVGIDIESTDRRADMDRIAARLFLPEETEHLKTLAAAEKTQYFFRCWTRTESFLKGLGTGLSASLTDEKIRKRLSSWTLEPVTAPEGYLCCAAYYNFYNPR